MSAATRKTARHARLDRTPSARARRWAMVREIIRTAEVSPSKAS